MKMTKLKRKKEKKSTHSVLKSCNICNDYLNYINILFKCITMFNREQYIHVALVIRELINLLCPVKLSIVPMPSPQRDTEFRVKPEQTYTKDDSSITLHLYFLGHDYMYIYVYEFITDQYSIDIAFIFFFIEMLTNISAMNKILKPLLIAKVPSKL